MRQFAVGSSEAFSELWTRLSAAPKYINYNVVVKPDLSMRLTFDSTVGGGAVRVELKDRCGGDVDASRYTGDSEFIRLLLAGAQPVFDSPESMRERFSEMRIDYPERGRAAANGKAEPSMPRHVWTSKAIDPVELAEKLKTRIVGQDEQLDDIAKCVCNHLRKKKPRHPLTIMLSGPTGVGKSETAKVLAEVLQDMFGEDVMPLISINCNEYRERHRISQFIGSPAGYVGYDDACVMERIKQTNSIVVMLDEFEKAHPDIHTAVMTWLDSGKVTLARIEGGESSAEYDCAASIIIMTSNINMRRKKRSAIGIHTTNSAQPSAAAETAFERNDRCRKVMVDNGFKPEIAGRISYFFEYKQLADESCKKILELAFIRKATEYGAVIDSIDGALAVDMFERFGRSAFGVRPFEYALDDILGKQLPVSDGEKDKHYAVGGTLEDLIFTEVGNETVGL